MATVRLSFSPAPVHVRTARLVGVAVARRAGVAEELLDEVRLAIGEACTLLAGFVDDLQVRPVEVGAGTEVRMIWPVHRR